MRKSPRRRRIRLAVFIAVIIAVLYGRYVEPRWFQVTHHEVVVNGLPRELDGLKMVQLSDIHRRGSSRDFLIRRAVRLANREKPDIVVLTGDFVSGSSEYADGSAKILSNLSPRLGSYAVLGNHDYWHGVDGVKAALKRHGIIEVTNDNRWIGKGLYLIGVDDVWAGKPDVKRAWSGVDETAGQLLITHSPVSSERLYANKNCVALTGHTHGGEIDLPPIPRSWLPGLLGAKYVRGWYQVGSARLYVSRGIGIVSPFRMRFHSRPEVSVFVLRSQEK